MSLTKFSRVISVSSEDPKYPGSNLLKLEISGCWKCKDSGEKQAIIILQLEKLTQIQSITIGNENSAFVELLVGKSAIPDSYEVLRVASVLMSVQEAKNDHNKNSVRFFKSEEFSPSVAEQSWDRLKIICSQPFNKHIQYGLSFVKVYGKFDIIDPVTSPKEETVPSSLGRFELKKEDREDDQPKVGSFFARRNDIDNSVSSAVAIRAASNDLSDVLNSSTSKRLSDVLHHLKENKKKRKRSSVPDAPSLDDGRRSTTGPLLYVDSASNDDTYDLPKKKNENKTDETFDPSKKKKEVKEIVKPSTPQRTNSIKKQKCDTKSNESSDLPKIIRKPFNRLLEDVIFVISGYQNPFRAELRSKAVQMGAKYKANWDSTCTHLICAFSNTPKSNQVRGCGWIVRKDWIEDCYTLRKRFKCVGYELDKNNSFSSATDIEIWEETSEDRNQSASSLPNELQMLVQQNSSDDEKDIRPGSSQHVNDSSSVFDVDTDIDSDQENSATKKLEHIMLKVLPDFFNKKTFYLGTDLVLPHVTMIKRYILAYKGSVMDDIDNVNFIISGDTKYKENVFNAPVVVPDWIWECNDQKSFMPIDPYLLD